MRAAGYHPSGPVTTESVAAESTLAFAVGHLAPVQTALPCQQHPPHAGRLGSRVTRRLVVASRRCLAVGAHMHSGRFNFWRLLLYTRAITPRRVPVGLWRGSVFLRRGGWSLLLLGAVLAAGVVVRLSQRDAPLQSSAIDPPPTSAPLLGPAPLAQRW
jgi:hypothetical protein